MAQPIKRRPRSTLRTSRKGPPRPRGPQLGRKRQRIRVVRPSKTLRRTEDFKAAAKVPVYRKGKFTGRRKGPIQQLKAGYKFGSGGTVVRDPNRRRVRKRRAMQRRRRV